MRRVTFIASICAWIAASAPAAQSQVLRDLEPIELKYTILWGDPSREVVGTADVAFTPIDTKRGRRLEVKCRIQYSLPRETTFEYEEESTLICDEKGAVRFETVARAIGKERINSAIRVGDEYHITTEFDGRKRTSRIPATVQSTNIGLFAGGFLEERLDEGPLMQDYPLLYPVGGEHKPRQKIREATLPFNLGADRIVSAMQETLRKTDGQHDRIWNTTTDHQIMLRMEEKTTLGLLIYELASVNDESPFESELIQ